MNVDLEILPEQQALFSVEDRVEQEFEVRLRMNSYRYGISPQLFHAIQSVFKSSYEPKYEAYEHIIHEKIDKTENDLVYRVKKGKEITTKKSISKTDIVFLGFSLRIAKANEKKIDKTSVVIPPDYRASLCRWIERSTFEIPTDLGICKVDCSIVTNKKIISQNQCAPLSNPDPAQRTEQVSYEVELEFKPTEEGTIFFDYMYPILKKVVGVLYTSLPVPRNFMCLQENHIAVMLRDLCMQMKVDIDQTKVTYPFPSRHEVEEFNREIRRVLSGLRGLAVNIKAKDVAILDTEQYALTNKLDGERKLLYIHQYAGKRMLYCMNSGGPELQGSALDMCYALPIKQDGVIPDSVMDCELDHGTFWMFDSLFQQDVFLPQDVKPHLERMKCIDPSWLSTIPFEKKRFYYKTLESNILSLVQDFPNPKHFFAENDGFIFTYTKGSYADTNKLHPHLKYKFSSKLSLDFRISYITNPNRQLQQRFPDIPFLYFLFSNENHEARFYRGQQREHGILQSLTPLENHAVVECLWYKNKWVMLRYRADRDKGNSESVVKDVFEDMTTPLSLDVMFASSSPAVKMYRNELAQCNHSFVSDHFHDSMLSLVALTSPLPLVLQTIRNVLGITEVRFENEVYLLWKKIAQYGIPRDIDVLSFIFSLLHNEFFWIYTETELNTIHTEYKKLFPLDTVPSIFDVRSFKLLNEANIVCKAKHHWVTPSVGEPLPSLSTANKTQFTTFSSTITSVNPEYRLFVTVPASEYSSLKPWEQPQVSAIYKKWFPHPERIRRIVDGTAHVGVDTIHFAKSFQQAQIDAFEVVPTHAVALQQNIERFRLSDRIRMRYEDVATWVPTEKVDIMYIDPPWGGPSYKDKKCLDLYLQAEDQPPQSNKNINYMIDQWMNTRVVKHILLKIPFNFNKSYLATRYKIEECTIYSRRRTFAYSILHIQATIPFLYKPKSNLTVWSIPYIATSYDPTTTYDPIFINTNAVLVRLVKDENIEMVRTRLYYYMCQPFTFEKPELLQYMKLFETATKYNFQQSGKEIVIEDKSYLLFVKKDMDANQEESTMLQDMKKYHNLEKKYLIKNYAHKKTVLDLGAGFGGDLFKYEEAGVTRLILVEPNQSNLLTLKSRLDNTSSIQYNSTLVYAAGQDWDIIQPYVQDRVDVVSSFFSLTFLFESIEILRGFLHTVHESLLEGGYFIGTMMSGEKTYQLLESKSLNEQVTIGSDILMKKEYENGPPRMGMQLHITINDSIVTQQTEYLAFFSILQTELEAIGFELITVFDFQPPTKLKPYEIEFSQLNVGFVFRKSPTRLPYATVRVEESVSTEFINLYGESQVFIRTGVQKPLSFYHSFLYNTSHPYRQASSQERMQLAETLYHSFVKHIKKDIPPIMTIDLLPAFMAWENCNIYMMNVTTRKPMRYDGIVVSREHSIIMAYFQTNEYEPIAIVKDNEAQRIFTRLHPFIAHLHRKRQ